jgi:hypothetical protein
MADNTQDAMAAAGFTQAPVQGGVIQQSTQFVQAPQPIPVQPVIVAAQPQPVQVVQTPVTTNISPTTVVSGTDNTVTFSSIIQDNSGGVSSMRILMLLWGVGVLAIWSAAWIVGMFHGVYAAPTIPSEIVTILLGITGTKCVQRFGEK